ncbi:MAG: hypothetical protein IBJ11_04670 [Phycisphaerales bacterium]|nr:hypothetical protein [Phycisphaerales bacterium]
MNTRAGLVLGLVCAAALGALTGGCAVRGVPPPPPPAAEAASGRSAAEAPAHAAALTAREAYPALFDGVPLPRTDRYTVADGVDAGKQAEMTFEPSADGDIAVSWTIAGESRPRNVRVLRVRADGAVVMPRMINQERAVVSVFDPPLLVFPGEARLGSPVSESCAMKVHPIDDLKKLRERGKATSEVVFEAVGSPPIGLGGAGARVVRTIFKSTLEKASAVRTTVRWHAAPGGAGGLLAESWEEKIKILGLFGETSRQRFFAAP